MRERREGKGRVLSGTTLAKTVVSGGNERLHCCFGATRCEKRGRGHRAGPQQTKRDANGTVTMMRWGDVMKQNDFLTLTSVNNIIVTSHIPQHVTLIKPDTLNFKKIHSIWFFFFCWHKIFLVVFDKEHWDKLFFEEQTIRFRRERLKNKLSKKKIPCWRLWEPGHRVWGRERLWRKRCDFFEFP